MSESAEQKDDAAEKAQASEEEQEEAKKEMEELETSEIADILGCGESTVRNHLFNARKILRREIGRLYPEFVRGVVKA